ncbi:MAG: Cu(I)-responsive transcriptional regulator [Devosia sp.]
MNIGQAAQATGISTKMIRYYEGIGLISSARRTETGYRVYTESDFHALRFIHRARDLGFSVERMRELTDLWRDRSRSSAHVRSIAIAQIAVLEERSKALLAMINTLRHLAAECHGDDGPECAIIDGFAGAKEAPLLLKRVRRFGVAAVPGSYAA